MVYMNERILIVDDDVMNLKVAESVLKDKDYEVLMLCVLKISCEIIECVIILKVRDKGKLCDYTFYFLCFFILSIPFFIYYFLLFFYFLMFYFFNLLTPLLHFHTGFPSP